MISFCSPDPVLNEFGVDVELTGTDQIFIRDDFYGIDDHNNHGILVNGGCHIWFRPKEKVVKLAQYSELIRVIEMVKEGNPSMELGPNDFNTRIYEFEELYGPNSRDHLLKSDIDYLKFDESKNSDITDEENDDEDENELPF